MKENTRPWEVVYKAQLGESIRLLKDGRVLVVHPERKPFVIYPNGERKEIIPVKGEIILDFTCEIL